MVRYAARRAFRGPAQLVAAPGAAMAAEQDRTGRAALDCFIQVSLTSDAGAHRGGAAPGRGSPRWPNSWRQPPDCGWQVSWPSPRSARIRTGAFEKLPGISSAAEGRPFPDATGISAGMSQDLEAAIRFGATHLRIGSDILGSRPAVR